MKEQNHTIDLPEQAGPCKDKKQLYEKPRLGAVQLLADQVLSGCSTSVELRCDLPFQASMH